MFRTVAAALAIALLCAPVVHGAVETRTHTTYQVRRGTKNLPPAPVTKQECIDRAHAAAEEEGKTRTTGANDFQCHDVLHVIATFKPNPTCPALPPPEGRVVLCPSGTTGAYTQTRSYSLATYPVCAAPGEWTPTTPPASCVPTDTDSDGVPDSMDQCPTVPSSTPDGCPATPPTCDPAPADRQVQCPTNYTGTWTQRATVGAYPGCVITWVPVAFPPEACTPTSQPPAPEPLFRDAFEYDASRGATNVEQLFATNGWSAVKAENSREQRGDGYVFTRQDLALGSRVLVLESRPQDSPPPAGFPYSQTDYYLQRGSESGSTAVMPPNTWIQFWTYATPESRFSTRDKTIYPCRGAYPCHPTWLFMWGSGGFEDVSAPAGGRYLALEADGADRDTRTADGQERKLYQNASRAPLLAGRWYQIRLHIDISTTQGVYEVWIRERGQVDWLKVADWRSGVTPNFRWTPPDRSGYRVFRMPTTVNAQNNTVYIDDFVIGRSLAELPAN